MLLRHAQRVQAEIETLRVHLDYLRAKATLWDARDRADTGAEAEANLQVQTMLPRLQEVCTTSGAHVTTGEAPGEDLPPLIMHNDRAKPDLGWRPRPAETTIVETADSLRDLCRSTRRQVGDDAALIRRGCLERRPVVVMSIVRAPAGVESSIASASRISSRITSPYRAVSASPPNQ